MRRTLIFLAFLFVIKFNFPIGTVNPSFGQEWRFQKPKGTLKVVDLFLPSASLMFNYAEPLVDLDNENNWIPCLAEDWRWINDRTIEFKLREAVRFHNGESFNAEAVSINWEAYKKMKNPRLITFTMIPDDTILEILSDYIIRFTFKEPDGLIFVKLLWFHQIAPAFFKDHKFEEYFWGRPGISGPWGTGPFELVEGNAALGDVSDRFLLEAFDGYWDRRYPKVKRIIFDNTLTATRQEAMRLCREEKGAVDLVSHIRPLDTLKVAESDFAKVLKSKDPTQLGGWFNQRKSGSKWKDFRLRKAVNYAINREELWKYAAKGNAYNLGGFIPPGAFGHNQNLTRFRYDTDEARRLLIEAGYPNGFEISMITYDTWKLEAQLIGRMLGRIGIKVNLDILPAPQYYRKVYIPILDQPPREQDWDITMWYIADWFGHTGASFLGYNFIEESNYRWIEYDPEYEAMWKEMVTTVEKDAQEDKIQQMVQYVYDKGYNMVFYFPLFFWAVSKEVNFVPHESSILRLKETSVTENHWSVRGKND